MSIATLSTAYVSQTAIAAGTAMRLDEDGAASIADPLTGEAPRPGQSGDTVASRQCGRCRVMFPGDPTLHPTALPEWWLCPPCRLALLGTNPPRHAPTGSPARAGAHDAR